MQTRRGKVLNINPADDDDQSKSEDLGSRVPAFLTKTWELSSDDAHADIVSWSEDGLSFTIWQPAEFSRDLLPLYFKHSNLASFVRQLNTYGFQKSSPDRWEFTHPNFRSDRPDLLTQVPRRRTNKGDHHSRTEGTALTSMALEMDALKRDREVIVKEVLTLRRQQQAHQQETDMLHSRLNQTEQLHQQLLKALTSAVQDPAVQQALAARPSLQLTDGKPEGVKRKREPDQASQLIPFKSAASELVAMLLNTPIPQLQRPAEGTSEAAPEPTSSRTARLRCEMPMAADKSSSQQDMLTFVPMASSGGVEAMPAISPFTSAAEHAFDRPALPAQEPVSQPQPPVEEEKPVDLSAADLLISPPAGGGSMWGLGSDRRSNEWRYDVLGSQPSWSLPVQMEREAVH